MHKAETVSCSQANGSEWPLFYGSLAVLAAMIAFWTVANSLAAEASIHQMANQRGIAAELAYDGMSVTLR